MKKILFLAPAVLALCVHAAPDLTEAQKEDARTEAIRRQVAGYAAIEKYKGDKWEYGCLTAEGESLTWKPPEIDSSGTHEEFCTWLVKHKFIEDPAVHIPYESEPSASIDYKRARQRGMGTNYSIR